MSTAITSRSDSSRPDSTMRPSLASCNTRAQRTEAAPDGGDSLGDSRTGAPEGCRARSGVSSRARWTSLVGRFGCDLLDLIGRDGDRGIESVTGGAGGVMTDWYECSCE